MGTWLFLPDLVGFPIEEILFHLCYIKTWICIILNKHCKENVRAEGNNCLWLIESFSPRLCSLWISLAVTGAEPCEHYLIITSLVSSCLNKGRLKTCYWCSGHDNNVFQPEVKPPEAQKEATKTKTKHKTKTPQSLNPCCVLVTAEMVAASSLLKIQPTCCVRMELYNLRSWTFHLSSNTFLFQNNFWIVYFTFYFVYELTFDHIHPLPKLVLDPPLPSPPICVLFCFSHLSSLVWVVHYIILIIFVALWHFPRT